MAYDLVTFGEAMIRLTAPGYQRLEQARSLDVSVGGAEWNVAVNVARLGLATAWVSRLVDTWSGRLITEEARRHGVDTSHIVWEKFDGVGRVRNGFYHLEIGAGPRSSAVTYDRGHSAASGMSPEMVPWPSVYRTAAAAKVRTSFDLNYRGKLWKPEEAQAVVVRIVPHLEVLIGNEEDFQECLGLKAKGTGQDCRALDPEGYKEVVREAVRRYSVRRSYASWNGPSSTLPTWPVAPVRNTFILGTAVPPGDGHRTRAAS